MLLTVHAKTALGGGICQSPSAMMSGNTSPRPGDTTCSGGRSPGFWKVPEKFSYWERIAVTPTFKSGVDVGACEGGIQGLSLDDIQTQGTSLSSTFPGGPANFGFWAVLAFPTEVPGGQLLRHLVAAYLNAGYFNGGAEKYPLTQSQVIEMWKATSNGGLYGTSGWTAEEVINYISGMYDISANVEPSLCNKNKKK